MYLGLLGVVILALYFLLERALRSPWGRVLRAIREDEVAAAAQGKNVAPSNCRRSCRARPSWAWPGACTPTTPAT